MTEPRALCTLASPLPTELHPPAGSFESQDVMVKFSIQFDWVERY